MKKFRILAVIVVMLLCITALASCDKISVDKVNEDPMAAISNGASLTFANTPLSGFTAENSKVAYELSASDEENDFDMAVYTDAETGGFVFDMAMESPSDYEWDEESGESEATGTETITAALYLVDGKLVVSSSLLEDVIGTDTIGIALDLTEEKIKESELYKALVEVSGLSEEEFEEAFTSVSIDNIEKAVEDYAAAVKELYASVYEDVESAAEETLTMGDEEVKTIAVTLTINEKFTDDLADLTVTLVKDVVKCVEESGELTDVDIEEIATEISDAMPEISGEQTYYLSAKTGALVKMTQSFEVTATVDEETSSFSQESEITFGADPTKSLMPAFTYEIEVDGEKTSIEAESAIEEDKLVVTGNIADDTNDYKADFTFKIDSEGEFTLTVETEDNDYEVTGSITSTENEVSLKADLSKAHDEGEASVEDLELTVKFGEELPSLPKYKDILSYTYDELEELFTDYGYDYDYDYGYDSRYDAEFFRGELEYAYGEEQLNESHVR